MLLMNMELIVFMCDMVITTPCVNHIISVVSQFFSNPSKDHWQAVRWVLIYLRGTSKVCLCFRSDDRVLDDYTNVDMVGYID